MIEWLINKQLVEQFIKADLPADRGKSAIKGQGGLRNLAFRVMTPDAGKRTAFEKHSGADARPVFTTIAFQVKYDCLKLNFIPPSIRLSILLLALAPIIKLNDLIIIECLC